MPSTLEVARRKGVDYAAANVATIPIEGETVFKTFTEEGGETKMVIQTHNVEQSRLSVSKVEGAGNRVVFHNENTFIGKQTHGERTSLKEQYRMFTLSRCVLRHLLEARLQNDYNGPIRPTVYEHLLDKRLACS